MKKIVFVFLLFIACKQESPVSDVSSNPAIDAIIQDVVNRSNFTVNRRDPTKIRSGVRYVDDVFTSVVTTNDIAYGSAVNPYTGKNETLTLNRYRPSGDNETGRWSILFAHGGGFWSGSKSQSNGIDLCVMLAKKGYVVFSIDYRLLPQSMRGDWTAGTPLVGSDYRAAIRFIRSKAAQYGLDESKITGFGSSAGSFGALAAAYDAALDSLNSSNQGYVSEPNLAASSGGALPSVAVMDAGEAPLYMMNCTSDPVVPFSLAQAVYEQAQALGIDAEMFTVNADCHTFIDTAAQRQDTANKLATWIYSKF